MLERDPPRQTAVQQAIERPHTLDPQAHANHTFSLPPNQPFKVRGQPALHLNRVYHPQDIWLVSFVAHASFCLGDFFCTSRVMVVSSKCFCTWLLSNPSALIICQRCQHFVFSGFVGGGMFFFGSTSDIHIYQVHLVRNIPDHYIVSSCFCCYGVVMETSLIHQIIQETIVFILFV